MEVKRSEKSSSSERHLLRLPPAPKDNSDVVKAWSEPVTMLSFLPNAPDRNPLFLNRRVYQGSSGRVYPLPVIDRIATAPVEHSWKALHLENEYLRLMVLPEIGGRIHIGLDKTNGYDFFYRQNVIKPALVGLAGPWMSGGVEFNWPQHHRPSTFMPVETEIERHSDGSTTLWCSDYDPMTGLKGMHGLCLHPGKAYLELKVRLYNNTQSVQTFLWWANAAVRVNETYQSFFPQDARWVADHARRAVSSFPLAEGTYYGIDYGERARSGVPPEEAPPCFVPGGSYPANDLSWYANIPVPTSYMVVSTEEDFFGGYDHAAEAGLVHIADHHIAPGKKQWTWGNHEFGYAWDRCLTEDDGPYIELMAGVYTDNQPDFSFLAPGETRSFSQFWYPIRKIGPVQAANLDVALSLTVKDARARVGICATRAIPGARVRVEANGVLLKEWFLDLQATDAFLEELPLPNGVNENEITITIDADGATVLSYRPGEIKVKPPPVTASEPHQPKEVDSTEELYLIGLHLEQYRHATRHPEVYWQEALRRDPEDSRSNNAMGKWYLRRGQFVEAEQHFRRAIARITRWNANPYDGEAYYNLGLSLQYQERDKEAYDAFFKATWNAAWRSAACYALAQCDARRQRWRDAETHVSQALLTNSNDLNARNFAVILLARLGRQADAEALLDATRRLDPLDMWSRFLTDGEIPIGGRKTLMLASLQMSAGLWSEAGEILEKADTTAKDGFSPLLLYALARCYEKLKQPELAATTYQRAAASPADYCFPSQLQEMILLEFAIASNPGDARAHYYLANLFYNAGRHDEAILEWERATDLDPSFPTAWRNLGIAHFNISGEVDPAKRAFDRAMANSPEDARVLYERDQLWKRTGTPESVRLSALQQHPNLLELRDDLAVELATLLNQLDRPQEALELLLKRKFQPWEGGEGLVLEQFTRAHLKLGRRLLADGKAAAAIRHFESVLHPPHSLGEAKHLLANQSDVYYWLGDAYAARGDAQEAGVWWQKAARQRGDFQQMAVQPVSEMTYWSALALRRLGDISGAEALLHRVIDYAEYLEHQPAQIDYFATSLPTMLLFEVDLAQRNRIDAGFLRAQALYGLGHISRAEILLRQVLELDRNHVKASELVNQIDADSNADGALIKKAART
jgi:tetratricopeptide (TPR) repeat protein